MADANIFVDYYPEPPSDIGAQLKQIFGVLLLEDIGRASSCDGLFEAMAS
jgi:hypothetical protein